MTGIRRRNGTETKHVEYRAASTVQRRADDSTPGFTGHASTWWAVDSYGTAMAPGAFDKTLSERGERIPHLWQHDPEKPIGKHREIAPDDQGLFVDVELIDDGAAGTTAIKLLRGGVPLGLSFGFRTIQERQATENDPLDLSKAPEWIKRNPLDVYIITEVKLYEDSTVTFAANENATIDNVRAVAQLEGLASLVDDLQAGRGIGRQRQRLLDELAALIEGDIAARRTPGGSDGSEASPRPDADARQRQLLAALDFDFEANGLAWPVETSA